MFECPECGGAVETTPNCYFCVACDYFDERHFVNLDGGRAEFLWPTSSAVVGGYEREMQHAAA
jgi:hypothetical protein